MTIDELKVVITAVTDGLRAGVQDAKKSLEGLKRTATKTSDEINASLNNIDINQLKAQYRDASLKIKEHRLELKKVQSELVKSTGKAKEYKRVIEEVENIRAQWTEWGMGNVEGRINDLYPQYADAKSWQSLKDQERNIKQQIADAGVEAQKLKIKIDEVKGSANKTANAISGIKKALNGVVGIFKRMAIRKILFAIVSDLKECFDLLMRFDDGLGNTLGYNKALSDLKSQFKQLGANIAAVTANLLTAFGPALTSIISLVNKFAIEMSKLSAAFTGNTTYSYANPDYWKNYAKEVNTASKAQKQLIGGFDELNVYSSNATASYSEIDPNDLYVTAELEGGLRKIAEIIQKIKEWFKDIFGDELGEDIASLAGLIAALGLAAGAVKLLNGLFKNKNSLLGEQTLKTETETSAVSNLATQFSTVTSAVSAFALGLAALPAVLPTLTPQLDLNPAYSQINELSTTLSNTEISPKISTSGVSSFFSNLKEKITTFPVPNLVITPKLNDVILLQSVTLVANKMVEAAQKGINKFSEWSTEVAAQGQAAFTKLKDSAANWKDQFITTLSTGIQAAKGKWDGWITTLPTQVASVSAKILTTVTNTRERFEGWITSIPVTVNNAKQKVMTTVTTWASTTLATVNSFISNTRNNIQAWAINVSTNIKNAFTNTLTNITTWASAASTAVYRWAQNTANNVRVATNNIAQNVYSGFNSAAKNVSTWVSNTSSNIAKWASNAAGNIAKFCSNMVSNIKSAVQTGLAWLSKVFNGVSSWVSANSAAITAGLVATGVVAAAIALAPYTGGASLGGLALLADGGVVDRPTNALIGEYPGAKTNPEIVTPENKMREIFNESNGELVTAFAQMTKQVISAIQDVDMNVSIGDDVIARSAARGNNAYKRMTGATLI